MTEFSVNDWMFLLRNANSEDQTKPSLFLLLTVIKTIINETYAMYATSALTGCGLQQFQWSKPDKPIPYLSLTACPKG